MKFNCELGCRIIIGTTWDDMGPWLCSEVSGRLAVSSDITLISLWEWNFMRSFIIYYIVLCLQHYLLLTNYSTHKKIWWTSLPNNYRNHMVLQWCHWLWHHSYHIVSVKFYEVSLFIRLLNVWNIACSKLINYRADNWNLTMKSVN